MFRKLKYAMVKHVFIKKGGLHQAGNIRMNDLDSPLVEKLIQQNLLLIRPER